MASVKRNMTNKEIKGKSKEKTFIVSLSMLAVAFVVLIGSTILSAHRDSSPEQVSSSKYTGQITILQTTGDSDRCAFIYTRGDDPAGETFVNRSEPLCKMASIGPAYMEDGYLEYKSLVKALEAQR